MSTSITGDSQVAAGGTINLEAVVRNGKKPYSYQWYREGVAVGSDSRTYAGSAVDLTAGQVYIFTVEVEDAEGDTGTAATSVFVESPSGPGGDQCLVPPC